MWINRQNLVDKYVENSLIKGQFSTKKRRNMRKKVVKASNMIKKDCILYDDKLRTCKGLNELYCAEEETCAFYKSCKQYLVDGTRRKHPLGE